MKPRLSVILSVFNEESLGLLPEILESFRELNGVEVLCVDGGSRDGTRACVEAAGGCVSWLDSRLSTRAERMNLGYRHARGEMILWQHPRSLLKPEAIEFLLTRVTEPIWGGFTHGFDRDHPLLRFTSWYSNRIRPRMQKVLYLDHCIFAHRSLLAAWDPAPVPEVEIFEDTLLSRRLARTGAPVVLPFSATTSAVRFVRNGIYRQALLNQAMKLGFYLGVSPKTMNRIYEAGLGLNSKSD